MIEEIKKILYDPKKDKDKYKRININNGFNNNYIEYQRNGGEDEILSVKEYLDMIKLYLNNMINNHKNQNECKILLSLTTNFKSSNNFKET